MEKFHEKLKVLRKKKGLTQKEVARLLGTVQGVYSKWERGVYEPNYENLSMLACIFDVSIDFLSSDRMYQERCIKLLCYESRT